jgi:UDP-N-acetylmuramate--alanine ligase
MNAEPWAGRRLHFVGVGGSGMSGYARAARALGASVSGSDRAPSPYLERLREEGVLDAHIGHAAQNVPAGADVELVHSSAVPEENPERRAAAERGLVDRPRAELLGELSAMRRTIAVAGAHGKTSTSAMLVHILLAAGFDPGWLVGSSVGRDLENSRWSEGEWLIVEADESDRSMLSLRVEIALLTNVELDHHSSFASLEELREAFRQFLAAAPQAVIWDRPDLRELRDGPAAFYDLTGWSPREHGSIFSWREHEVRLGVPGAHNALNALGALEAATLAGVQAQPAMSGLAGFKGAGRRFQPLGRSAGGALLYEDYAHHPTEIAATLAAARTLGAKRVVAVFQPHLYSRTALLGEEFGAALAQADVVLVLDVYPARERAEDYPGVSGLTLVRATESHSDGLQVLWTPGFEEAEVALAEVLEDGDLCVVMGAGDVDRLGHRLVCTDV